MGLVSLAVLVVALINVGSPTENRLLSLDQKRINDLNNFNVCVQNFWFEKKALPESLGALEDWGRCYNPDNRLTDPETQAPYGYEKLGPDKYKLCATFSRAGQGEPYWPSGLWQHPAGEHCFGQTVNVDESGNIKGLVPLRPVID